MPWRIGNYTPGVEEGAERFDFSLLQEGFRRLQEKDEVKPMEEMHCPKCQGTQWTVYAVLFETGGTLLELFVECPNDDTRLRLGVVDGNDITTVSAT